MLFRIKNIAQRNLNFILAIIYCTSILFLSSRHVVWRDEVRAFSIVTDCPSFLSMTTCLRNEGHPFLWYYFLRLGNLLLQDPVSLKIVNFLICSFAICFFIFKSPFTSLEKFLFSLGLFPVYHYAVVNRGYSLCMALMFLIANFYLSRFKRPVFFGILLFLLANSEFHSLLIAISLVFWIVIEAIIKRNKIFADRGSILRFCLGMSVALTGIAFSVVQIYPDQLSNFESARALSIEKIFYNYKAIIFAGKFFSKAADIFFIPAYITLWFYYILLLQNPFLLLINVTAVSGLALSDSLIYVLRNYHQGFLLLMIVSSFWIEIKRTVSVEFESSQLSRAFYFGRKAFLCSILVTQLNAGYIALRQGIPFSNSRMLADYIKTKPDLKDAIIIGEPDYYQESLPYYIGNRIFLPRENRFSKRVKFTSENSSVLSLRDLLNVADSLKAQHNQPILISLGFKLSFRSPFEKKFFCNRKLTYSESEIAYFMAKTIPLKQFNAATVTGESYYLYLLK